MGNGQPESQKFSNAYWRKINTNQAGIEEYENTNDNSIHIEKHHFQTPSQEQFEKIKQLSYLRKNNPRWVSALYFEYQQTSSFCSPHYAATLYLQKISHRLSQCNPIPFPQILHLYDQVLQGYWQLSQLIGFFEVEPEYIGINERRIAKVWGGPHWHRISVRGNICQQQMVQSILECLNKYVDRKSMPYESSIHSFINQRRISQFGLSFDGAIKRLKDYAKIMNIDKLPTSVNYDSSYVRQGQIQMAPQAIQYIPIEQARPKVSYIKEVQDNNLIRRVNSFSNFQNVKVFKPQYPIKNHQGQNANSARTITKSLSNPNFTVRKINPPLSNPPITFAKNVPKSINQSSVSNNNYTIKPQINRSSPKELLNNQGNNIQSNKFTINKQSELVIYPPSQSQISPSLIASTHHAYIRMQTSPVQTPSAQNEASRQIRNAQQSQSIIIQLYKQPISLSKKPLSQTFKYDTSNIIANSKTSQNYFTPIGGIKNDLSNLNSIEEVQTEHYWKDNEVSPPKHVTPSEPYSLSNIKQTYQSSNKYNNQLVLTNKYNVIDQNDGKSSPQFLRKLKEIDSYSYNEPNHQYNANYQSSYKQYPNFEPSFNYMNYDSYGSAQSLSDKYTSKFTTLNAIETYQPTTIDPDIWADIKGKKY